MLTIAPPPRPTMCRTTRCVQKNMLRVLKSKVWAKSWSVISSDGTLTPAPVLFTRPSMRPKRSDRRGNERVDRGQVGDIERLADECRAEFAGLGLERVEVGLGPAAAHDAGPGLRRRQRDRPPEAAPGTGDDNDLAPQIHVASCPRGPRPTCAVGAEHTYLAIEYAILPPLMATE